MKRQFETFSLLLWQLSVWFVEIFCHVYLWGFFSFSIVKSSFKAAGYCSPFETFSLLLWQLSAAMFKVIFNFFIWKGFSVKILPKFSRLHLSTSCRRQICVCLFHLFDFFSISVTNCLFFDVKNLVVVVVVF